MEIRETTVTKTEKIYTLTEKEYMNLKNQCKAYGSAKTREYISFCLANYHLKLNIGGVFDLVHDLCDFFHGSTDYIPNVCHWDLYEWLDHNKE